MATLTAADMFADYPRLTTTDADDLTRSPTSWTWQRQQSSRVSIPSRSETVADWLLPLTSPPCQTATIAAPHRGLVVAL